MMQVQTVHQVWMDSVCNRRINCMMEERRLVIKALNPKYLVKAWFSGRFLQWSLNFILLFSYANVSSLLSFLFTCWFVLWPVTAIRRHLSAESYWKKISAFCVQLSTSVYTRENLKIVQKVAEFFDMVLDSLSTLSFANFYSCISYRLRTLL